MIAETYEKGIIFLVEDNEEVSRMYERVFRLGGYEVRVVRDGENALPTLFAQNQLPAAILLDLMIPGKSGEDVLRDIRANPAYNNIPIAMLTNSIQQEKESEILALGADLFLIKMDIQAKDIVVKIRELITRGRGKASQT